MDSSSAAVVIAALKRASLKGLTVVCTIHQPSRIVFESFDNLLLLRKGGVCVYQGCVDQIATYIDSIVPSLTPTADENPADKVLEVFCGNNDDSADWITQYNNSRMAEEAWKSHETSCEQALGVVLESNLISAEFWTQLYYVLNRQVLAHWRNPSYTASKLHTIFFRLNKQLLTILQISFFCTTNQFVGGGQVSQHFLHPSDMCIPSTRAHIIVLDLNNLQYLSLSLSLCCLKFLQIS